MYDINSYFLRTCVHGYFIKKCRPFLYIFFKFTVCSYQRETLFCYVVGREINLKMENT